jgi:hypothetical protein
MTRLVVPASISPGARSTTFSLRPTDVSLWLWSSRNDPRTVAG